MSKGEESTRQEKDAALMKGLRLIVHRAGGAKRVAGALWPKMNLGSAHQRLLACLDVRRRQYFAPEDLIFVLRVGKEVADHSTMELFATMSGYSKPYPVSTEDERADLQRRYLKAAEESKEALAKFEELDGRLKRGK